MPDGIGPPLTKDRTRLSAWRGAHRGGAIVVCGCGSSLTALHQPARFTTIGVNDVGRGFQPDYLVVLDGPEHLGRDRFRYVESSSARALFTQRDTLLPGRSSVVRFAFEEADDASKPSPSFHDVLPYSAPRLMTPYVALCLALYMGATTIGLIGVDLTDHHFFGNTGAHDWTPHANSIDERFAALTAAHHASGVRIFNLSEQSRLRAFPKMSVAEFTTAARRAAPRQPAAPPRRIVCYGATPRVGVPAILARCINHDTLHRARATWPMDEYDTGLSFGGDLRWAESPALVRRELEAADAIILHGGRVAPEHLGILTYKPVVTVAQGGPDGMDLRWVRRGLPGLVLAQHQPDFPAFAGWQPVPSPVPLHDPAFQPEPKHDQITIAYTPPARHDAYAPDHPLHWSGKGYEATMSILDRLADRHPIRLAVIRGRGLSHAAALAMKRRAHIVIDECVTGSFHRSSLEGLATGCVVVNGVEPMGAILGRLRHAAGDLAAMPFVPATLDRLEQVLETLIELGPGLCVDLGAQNRLWLERHWQFHDQWRRFWQPALDAALAYR